MNNGMTNIRRDSVRSDMNKIPVLVKQLEKCNILYNLVISYIYISQSCGYNTEAMDIMFIRSDTNTKVCIITLVWYIVDTDIISELTNSELKNAIIYIEKKINNILNGELLSKADMVMLNDIYYEYSK